MGWRFTAASLALLCTVILTVPYLFKLTRNLAWDRYLGELSYPLYICHFLIGWMVLPETTSGAYISVILSLALSAALSVGRTPDRPVATEPIWKCATLNRKGAA